MIKHTLKINCPDKTGIVNEISQIRITSYNVCYTKLLRVIRYTLVRTDSAKIHTKPKIPAATRNPFFRTFLILGATRPPRTVPIPKNDKINPI